MAEMLSQNVNQQGVLFDQPSLMEPAKQVFAEYDNLNRVKLMGGDFFKSIPQGGNLYTICRTLLNWSDEDAIKILNTCTNSMSQDAKLLIIDFALPHKSHPHYLRAALSDLNLLTIINSTNRTEEEWQNLVSNSQLSLKKTIITDENMEPEPFAPIIMLECQKK